MALPAPIDSPALPAARVLRPALFPMLLGLLLVAFAPSGCGALGLESPVVPGPRGGPWCANRVVPAPPPPPASCPAACTLGCQGPRHEVCVLDGSIGTTCPPGMPCRIECRSTSACQMAKITCPPDADCEIRCSQTSACQMATVNCPTDAACNLSCDATSTCQMASMTCGHGKCRSSCGGMSAALGRVDCSASCDCSTSCTDGGMGMVAGMGIPQVTAAMSPEQWQPRVSGRVHIEGSTVQASSATFTRCASGEPEGFHGVMVASDGQPAMVLRVAQDPDNGVRVHVSAPGLLSADLTRATCRKLDGALTGTGRAVNRVKLLDGSIALDCTTPDGVVIAGSITFASCHHSPTDVAGINADFAAIEADNQARVTSFPLVGAPVGEEPRLRPELAGLRVVVRASLVGGLLPGASESPEAAQKAVDAKAREWVQQLGWVPVDEGSPHDLTMDLAFTGHVTFVEVGAMTAVVLPPTDRPSLRLTAGSREILSVPVGPRGLRCEVSGTGQEREAQCAQRVSRGGNVRLVAAMNASQELAQLRRHPAW